MRKLTRREVAVAGILLPFLPTLVGAAGAQPVLKVTKDPNCGCCGGWVAYMRENGFAVEVVESGNLIPLKQRLGVPPALQSCHTAEIDGYVIEGHVPAAPVKRLLQERPKATGLAVGGMPASAPGMDVPGSNDVYDVVLFGASGERRYARYQGRRKIED